MEIFIFVLLNRDSQVCGAGLYIFLISKKKGKIDVRLSIGEKFGVTYGGITVIGIYICFTFGSFFV